MSKRFAVVYEADSDVQTATELADRALLDAIEWLDDDLLAQQSHELTARKSERALRSAKRAFRELSGDDRERERRCWRETALRTLRDRRGQNGLNAYLDEVRERLATLIGQPS